MQELADTSKKGEEIYRENCSEKSLGPDSTLHIIMLPMTGVTKLFPKREDFSALAKMDDYHLALSFLLQMVFLQR